MIKKKTKKKNKKENILKKIINNKDVQYYGIATCTFIFTAACICNTKPTTEGAIAYIIYTLAILLLLLKITEKK